MTYQVRLFSGKYWDRKHSEEEYCLFARAKRRAPFKIKCLAERLARDDKQAQWTYVAL